MDFKLTSQIIDNIIFGMENQGEEYIFDLEQCKVVLKRDVIQDLREDRYAVIPEWGPAQGFQLMEKFVGTLRNPIYRELLKDALAGGRGVFRKFKDVLKERDDIERLWFTCKEREMRKRVIEWYDATCECMGLNRLGVEPEDVDDLLLSDFIIQPAVEEIIPALQSMDRAAFDDMFEGEPEDYIEEMYRMRRKDHQIRRGEHNFIYTAETPGGETAGFIWGVDGECPEWEGRTFSSIYQVYVAYPFRGLGLAKLLLARYLEEAEERYVDKIFIELAGDAVNISRYLEQTGFRKHAVVFEIEPPRGGVSGP